MEDKVTKATELGEVKYDVIPLGDMAPLAS